MFKKLAMLAAAGVILSSGAMAAANPDSNGANKNCFGQGRSDYASGDQASGSVGSIISDRAHEPATSSDYPNNNVQQNKEYKAACQAA